MIGLARSLGNTLTVKGNVVLVLSPFAASVAVAMTCKVKVPVKPVGAVIEILSHCHWLMSIRALLGLAVKLRVPSVKVAPAGIADTCKDTFSEPSVSLGAATMLDSLIGPSL